MNRRYVGTAAILLLAAATGVRAALATAADSEPRPAPFRLLPPTGPFAVGTTSWHVTDPNRTETLSATLRPRQVEVLAWYPTSPAAANAGQHAPYLRESLAEARAFALVIRAPGVFDDLASVETHSVVDAEPAPGASRLPVLVFSHGYTGLASAYTALLEDLASHGYVVLSIMHPYEAAAVTLSDGSIVTLLDSAGVLNARVQAVIAEWKDEDSTMARVTRTPDDVEQRRILREYISGLTQTHVTITRWVDDTKLVLDGLASLSRMTPAGRLAARIDADRVGVFGHSMGGVVAGQFCVDDIRCRAGLNLDGIPQSGTMIDATMKQPFLMVYSARPGRLGASDAIYRHASPAYCRVDMAGTLHLDFSDMNQWGGPLAGARAHGPIAPDRAAELTRLIVREYFDQQLGGVRSSLLAGTVRVPEIRVSGDRC